MDGLADFLSNLHDDECSIIKRHGKNPSVLKAIKEMADADVSQTAKALAIEE